MIELCDKSGIKYIENYNQYDHLSIEDIGAYKIVTLPGVMDLCLHCKRSLGEGLVAVHSKGEEQHPVHLPCMRERLSLFSNTCYLQDTQGDITLVSNLCPHALHPDIEPNVEAISLSLYQPVTLKGRVVKLTVDILTHPHFKKILLCSSMLATYVCPIPSLAWLPPWVALLVPPFVGGSCFPATVGITGGLLWNNGKLEMFGVTASEEKNTHLSKLVTEKAKKIKSAVADCMVPIKPLGAAAASFMFLRTQFNNPALGSYAGVPIKWWPYQFFFGNNGS
jgi:hypothetical protein